MTTEATHWGYSGSTGPAHWGCLSVEYRPCAEGQEQSPVNITGGRDVAEPDLRFDYGGDAVAARNNGHTVYLDFAADAQAEDGNRLNVDGRQYQLLGVHYHSPGEHEVDGERFAAELHLVHQDADGNLAVVGLLYRLGDASPPVQRLLDAAPETGGATDLPPGIAASTYLPDASACYSYRGSLTTPPCTEGVRWFVMRSVGTVSAAQVAGLQAITGGPNNRPVQPLGGRELLLVGGG